MASATKRANDAEAARALRHAVPRSSHADWSPAPDRPDPVKLLVGAEDSPSVDLLRLRNARIAASPSAYLRGSAGMMAADLAHTPNIGVRVQACGDAHLGNFGIFATPERNVVFDLNDFDETLPAPYEWDLKRLAASVEVVLRGKNVTTRARAEIVAGVVGVYRRKVGEFAGWRALDIWHARISVADLVGVMPKSARASMLRDPSYADRARRKNHLGAPNKLTAVVDGHRRFIEDPPILVPLRGTGADLDEVVGTIDSYRRSLSEEHRALFAKFTLMDVARKVGISSVGTRCWIGLLEGPRHPPGDPLFLQIKQAGPSVLESYLGRSAVGHHGKRVVAGQRMIQTGTDAFLGYGTAPGSGLACYVRQLWDVKGSSDPSRMDLATLTRYAGLCAWVLARAHSRTGDAALIGGYLGKGQGFDKAVAEFARRYGDQNAADHAAVVQAIADGVLPAS
ncbi:MAG: hypothetical protein QOF39_155 [Frankiales bacterium]|nr:hypothetical protein [Frankiales bacterium]